MIPANAQKWLDALRSGEYSQTKGVLKDATGHCCLGVACEVYKANGGRLSEKATSQWSISNEGTRAFAGHSTDLPRKVAVWLGLDPNNTSGEFVKPDGDRTSLDYLNDEESLSFKQIARKIESKAVREQLFGKET